MGAAGVLGVGVAFAVTSPILKSSHVPHSGSIVVDGKGRTLYHASSERTGKIACKGNCVYFWFPVLAGKGKIALGKGVSRAKLGTIKRPGGSLQVTYNKLPLYRYYLDRKPGQVTVRASRTRRARGTWCRRAARS